MNTPTKSEYARHFAEALLDPSNADVRRVLTAEYLFHPSRKWRFDYAAIPQLLAVELDGGTHMVRRGKHGGLMVGGRHNSAGDREKLNEAARLGWRIMRFGPEELEHPRLCIEKIRTALFQGQATAGKDTR